MISDAVLLSSEASGSPLHAPSPLRSRRAVLASPTAMFTVLAIVVFAAQSASAQLGFTHRLVAVDFDYDNNGLSDASQSISYDGNGRATGVNYVYTGDGTPDLFVTEDDDAAQETSIVTYTVDDLVATFDLDRQLMPSGSESSDATYTYTGGNLTRFDAVSVLGGSSSESYGDFSYVSGRLENLAVRNAADDSILFLQDYDYGPDDLPNLVTLLSAGVNTTTTLNFRADGQLDDLTSTTSFGAMQLGVGTADYVYDANGRIQSESWAVVSGFAGSPFSEFANETYLKTYSYDGQNLRILEEIDIDDDGSVDATRTLVWQAGSCVPAFIFAPNGRPNFAVMAGFPFVPGTGATWLENCGPYPASGGPQPPTVPGLAPSAAFGLVALLGGFGWLQLRRSRDGAGGVRC